MATKSTTRRGEPQLLSLARTLSGSLTRSHAIYEI